MSKAARARALRMGVVAGGAVLAACGGGGGDTAPVQLHHDELGARVSVTGVITSVLAGQTQGTAQMAADHLLAQCNAYRVGVYGAIAQALPPGLLARLDETRVVAQYDRGERALTTRSTSEIDFVGFKQWQQALADTGSFPAEAPDCASHTLTERKTATLWIDGRRFELDYGQQRATEQVPEDSDRAPQVLTPALVGGGAPQTTVAGQACTVVAGVVAGMVVSDACVANGYGRYRYLNLPMVLRYTAAVGGATQQFVATVVELDAAMADDTFAIPAGFTIQPLP